MHDSRRLGRAVTGRSADGATHASPSAATLAADIPQRQGPVELVRSRLLHAIETQQLRPGDMLPSERLLGEQFAVSRVSVREAIIGLESVGLLTVRHGRGCYVSESISELVTRPFLVWLRVHRDEVIEILKVRAALDGLAAAEAARVDSAAVKARITDAAAEFTEQAGREPGDTVRLMHLDNEFHQAIVRGSGLAMVSTLLDELNGSVANSHRLTMSTRGRPEEAARQHDEIVEAVMAGDPERARTAAIRHVETLVALVLRYEGGVVPTT